MSFLGRCCQCSALLVALFAIFIGLLMSGIPSQMGMFSFADNIKNEQGDHAFMGIVPAVHVGTPWGFNMSEVPARGLAGKTFIVTGANVGLGYWTTYHLASRGGHVVMACRSRKRCDAAATAIRAALKADNNDQGGVLECRDLDLASLASVKQFAKEFLANHQKLHSLILNAGIMRCPFGLTEDGIERQIGVNHVGHFYLTQLLQAALEQTATASHPATVVAVSSSAHFRSYPEGIKPTLAAWNDKSTYGEGPAYGQSKLANVLFAQELAVRLQGKHVLVNAIHPGAVATDLARHMADAMRKALPPAIADGVVNAVLGVIARAAWHPREGSLTQVYAAVSPKLLAAKTTGKYFHPVARQCKPDSRFATNKTLQKHLWKLTQDIIDSKTS